MLNAVDPLFNVPIFGTCFASGVTYLDMADALRAAPGEAFELVGVKLSIPDAFPISAARPHDSVRVEADIVGRDNELAQIDAFLTQEGPRALLLEGEAGIGKTTLWRAGVERARARRYRILASSPSGVETTLSFAALRDLLDTAFDDAADELPVPQRNALAVALLREEPTGKPPPSGAVAAAVVGLLHRLAREDPLLVALDDVQWLDAPSARVVEFAGRRLGESHVAFFVARRVNGGVGVPLGLDRAFEERLSTVPVGALSLGALHRMLRDRLDAGFSRALLRRIHDASGGNPYFALEIGRLSTEAHELDPSGPLAVPEDLAELLGIRLARLSPDARHVALAVAALHDPTVALLERALVGDPTATLEELAGAHVLQVDGGRIRFTHPLLTATAYASAQANERRALHRCLAEVVESVEERARHLALGADGPDPRIAGALDEAARRARARGAPSTAAELAEAAIRLTPPNRPGDVLQRTIDSAGHHFEAGDPGRARGLLEDAVEAAASGSERAKALWRLARVHVFEADHRTASGLYSQALAEAGDDVEVRLEAEAGIAVAMMRMLEDLPAAVRHARAAVKIAEAYELPQMLPEYLARQALIEALLGRTSALALARRAARLEEQAFGLGTSPDGYFGRGLGGRFTLGVVLQWSDDLVGARGLIEAALRNSVEIGDESSVPLLLRYRATIAWLSGDWEHALRDAEEGYEVALQTRQPSQQAVLAGTRSLVLAHLGHVEEARETAEHALGISAETGAMFGTMLATSALGFLELSVGNAAEADRHLGPLVERMDTAGIREPGAARFVPDEIESLIALGRLDEAEALLSRLEERACRLDRPSALAAASRARGLLETARGRHEDGLAAFESALAEHDRVPMPFERARTLLALGSLERRAKQKRVARDSLHEALEAFQRLGARLWVERARTELASIGGRAPSSGGLTPTERRVAELVAEGRATKEVASLLFVSPKTVEGHLSRIYTKLGVHSRTELAARLRPGPTGS